MSGVGSFGAVPSNPPLSKPRGKHPFVGLRPLLAMLTLLVALALAVTNVPGLVAALSPGQPVS